MPCAVSIIAVIMNHIGTFENKEFEIPGVIGKPKCALNERGGGSCMSADNWASSPRSGVTRVVNELFPFGPPIQELQPRNYQGWWAFHTNSG